MFKTTNSSLCQSFLDFDHCFITLGLKHLNMPWALDSVFDLVVFMN